ncbi:MAG: hypothetical protein EXR52_07545 [Dehalococcoidia bacterium]|nr:hypothetical protein [Dehalococcoidia bacterium]
MTSRLSGLGFAAAVLLGGALVTLTLSGPATSEYWVEDLTGEASPVQQAKALVGLVRQRPIPTADFAPTTHAGLPPLGANTFFEQEVEEWKVRRSMEMLRDAGVKWIRQEFPWDRIEPSVKGRYEDAFGSTWTNYDRTVRLAPEYGLQVMPRLTLPPNWTRADNSVPRAPPDNYNDYGDFVAAVVERYRGRVHYYQLWNEPNTVLEWGQPPNAADFVRLLHIGYERAKRADPAAVIIAPALSPTIGTPDGANVSDLTFLQEMYEQGASTAFDIMSAQGYGLWTGPGDRRADTYRTNFARVQLVRELMVKNGDSRKPIWLAEMGWSALPPDFPGDAIHGRVTEEQQARYTAQALQRIQAEWPWVGVTFLWHFRRVSDDERSQAVFYFRMVDPDFTPRPVYRAVQAVGTEPPVLDYGWRPITHVAIARTAGWQSSVRTVDGIGAPALAAQDPGESLSFRVRGRQVLLQLPPIPAGGSLAVTVNQRPSGVIRPQGPGTGPTATAFLPGTNALPDGVNTIELRPVGDGLVVLAGIQVLAADREPAPMAAGVMVLLAALLALQLTFRASAGSDR